MTDTTVDKVKIEIEASARKAGDSIDKLIEVLSKLREATGNIQIDRLTDLNNSVANLSANMKNMPKASAFERLAKGIERLSQIDTSGIGAVTSAIDSLANSVAALNASGISNVRINVGDITAADMYGATYDATGDAAAGAQALATASEEVQNAAEGARDAVEEVASAEENAGRSSTTLAERLTALQAKWREIEDSFGARDIIGGAIYKMNSAVINGFSGMVSGARRAFGSLRNTVSSAVQSVAATVQRIPAELQYNMEGLKANLSNAEAAIKGAFCHPISTAIGGLRSLAETAGRAGGALGNMNLSGIQGALSRAGQIAGGIVRGGFNACATAIRAVGGAAGAVIPKLAAVAKGVLKAAASVYKSHSMFGRLSTSIAKAGKALVGLSGKLRSVTRLLTFMLLRSAFTALFKGMGEAFQHLAQKSESANAKISELVSACKNFQHQVVALAGPLLDIFGPTLTKIIDLLSTATAYINQFLSALTGKKFYTSAKKQNVDYAASVKKAAKEIKDATVGIDELNIIRPNDGGDSSGDDLEDCYEELAINQKILDMVQRLKGLLAELFQPMKQAWDDYGQGVIDAFNYALSACKKLVLDIAKTWKDVWLNGSGYELCKNILLLLTSILNWIGDIATAWDAAWQVKGYAYVQSIFDKLNAILSLVTTISESFRKAFNSGSGQEMIEHILQIFTDLNYVVANLANGFKKAWEAAGVGDAIAQAIFDIINLILGSVEKITGSTREWAKNLDFAPLLRSVKNLLEKVKPLVEKIGDALAWVWENVILPLGKWAIETALPVVIDAVATAFEALDAILEVLKPIFKWIWDHMLKPLAEWTGGTVIEIIKGITEVFKGIAEVFKKISEGEDWGKVGKYIWDGLIKGLKSVGSWLWDKLTDIFWDIVDFVKDLFGIHSPSTVFEEIGKNTIDGFINGIKNFASSCLGPIKNWAKGVIDWFTGGDGNGNIVEKFKAFGSDIVTGFRDKVGNAYNSVKTNVTTWASKVKEWFSDSGFGGVNNNTWDTYASNVITGFKYKIGNAYATTKDNIVTWATKVRDWFTSSSSGGANSTNFATYAAGVIDGFKTKIGSYYITSKDNMTAWASKVRDWFTNSSHGNVNNSKFQSFAQDAVDGFKSKIGSYYTQAKSDIETWASNCISWFNGKAGKENWESVAKNAVDGFKNKVGSIYSTCKNTIESWGSDIIKWIKDKLGIKSPSRVFGEIGKFTVEGFNEGIDSSGGSTAEHMKDWLGKFSDFQANVTARLNVKEVMDKYVPKYDTGITPESIERTVRQEINTEGRVKAVLENGGGFTSALEDVIDRTISKKLDGIETYTKRQAEKRETTNVYVGDREVAKSVEKQRRDNGFSFTPAPA